MVTVYTSVDYGDCGHSIGVGEYSSAFGLNDVIKSVKVSPGYYILLFEHPGFTGKRKAALSDVTNLDNLIFMWPINGGETGFLDVSSFQVKRLRKK